MGVRGRVRWVSKGQLTVVKMASIFPPLQLPPAMDATTVFGNCSSTEPPLTPGNHLKKSLEAPS